MATTSRTEVAAHLRLVVARTARRLRQEISAGLSPSQSSALATIARHGPLSPSELAAHERIQRPTATRLLARLQEDGLILRSADPSDGRCTRIAISDAGERLLHESRTRKNAYLTERLDGLSDDELSTLDQAAGILERLLDDEAPGR